MPIYIPTIGLEIHAELKTKTKMFCNSINNSDEEVPNTNVCPVCMGHPGTLPTINKKALMHVLRIGTAIGGVLADYSEFDRKNYFYPDMPKGYQISQYKYPLVSGGSLCNIDITRVHLEEDTARSTHDAHDTHTLLDFNRAGIPLMELVTEPVVKKAEDAVFFARELQLLLRYLGVSDANMEKGQMRVEANISVAPEGYRGTKVEIKNLNSFRVVEKAIQYEITRQSELLDSGMKVVQETRGWDEKKEVTFSQRKKEESHDYRYFPDPDLPSMQLSEVPEFQNLDKTLPELPQAKRDRYKNEFGIKDEDIELYVTNIPLGAFFEKVAHGLSNDAETIQIASNYITSDIVGILKTAAYDVSMDSIGKLDAEDFVELVKMATSGVVSSRGVKEILLKVLAEGKTTIEIAKEHNLFQKSDKKELRVIVEKIISANDAVVQEYKTGKERALQFLIGQAMKETKGAGNPQILSELFKDMIH